MTELAKAIKRIERFAKVEVYDKQILEEGKRSTAWYGRSILDIEYDGYTYSLECIGETKGKVAYYKDGKIEVESWCDKNDDGIVGHILVSNGITKDDEMYEESTTMISDDDARIGLARISMKKVKAVVYWYDSNTYDLVVYKDGKLIGADQIDLENIEYIKTANNLTVYKDYYEM